MTGTDDLSPDPADGVTPDCPTANPSTWDARRRGGPMAVTDSRTESAGMAPSGSTTSRRTRSAWRSSPSDSAGKHRGDRRALRAQARAERRAWRRTQRMSDSEAESLGRLAYVVLGGAAIGLLAALGWVGVGPVGALAGALVGVLLTVLALMI
jgi:hypothetical protein